MNKTVNINLAGIFFHIDEDAFAKLTNYLNAIRNSFSDPDGQDEIIKDIEVRISELFSEKIHRTSQVITLKELDEVISVMGQPEDYKVDEEIFNDSAPNEKQQTKRASSHKQVFRDTDDKFIAGVSSGLGHYFGIDVIWIRLVWVALVFLGFGAPILIYILLMILIPEATTTSEKLKMKREPVNISNIEKKIKEELKNTGEKISWDETQWKNNAKEGVSGFFTTVKKIIKLKIFLLKKIAKGLFNVFGKLFGISLIILSFSTIISLIIGLFTTGIPFGFLGLVDFDYSSIVLVDFFPFWLILLLVFLIVGIPAFALFILGLKLIITNLKSIGMTAKIILIVLWIFSIIGLSSLGIKQATEQAYDGEFITEKMIPIRKNDTLKLNMLSNDRYEYNESRSGNFHLKSDENGNKIIYSSNIRLIVRSTNDATAKVFINRKADGNSFENAKERAAAVDYHYIFNNNKLTLNSYFTTDISNKYRDQLVEVIVYLPIGSILYADKNTFSYHRNSSNYKDILKNGDEEKHLLINNLKTVCLDCEDLSFNVEPEIPSTPNVPKTNLQEKKHDSTQWVEEVNDQFKNLNTTNN
ncbi:MAG: PspC domain-containing protein [Flavobacteriales bacterium]|nr:MAG: PspC domain-containing protein [Flavobacteriales bacterium]